MGDACPPAKFVTALTHCLIDVPPGIGPNPCPWEAAMPPRSLNRRPHFRCVALLLGVFGLAVTLHAQEVQIKIEALNGRNGQPVAKSCVYVQVSGNPREFSAEEVATDHKGLARIRLSYDDASVSPGRKETACFRGATVGTVLRYGNSVDIIPNRGKAIDCRPPTNKWGTRDYSYPLKLILRRGIVVANTCGKATATPTPGEVILFVRPVHWWNPKVIWDLLEGP